VVARHYDRHESIQCHLTTNITIYVELLCTVLLQRKFVQVSSSVVYLSDRFSAQVVEVHVVQLFANTMSLYRKCTQISRFIIIHSHKIFFKHAGCRVCLLNNTNKCPRSMPSVLWRCWLGGTKGIRPVKNEWWGAGMVICLERGADLHMAQWMPLPLTVSCFSKIQIGFTFLVPAHQGSPGKRAVKWVCVCVIIP